MIGWMRSEQQQTGLNERFYEWLGGTKADLHFRFRRITSAVWSQSNMVTSIMAATIVSISCMLDVDIPTLTYNLDTKFLFVQCGAAAQQLQLNEVLHRDSY